MTWQVHWYVSGRLGAPHCPGNTEHLAGPCVLPDAPGQPPSARLLFACPLECRLLTCLATQTVHLTLRFAVILVDLLAICVKSFDLQDPVNLLQVASPSRVLCDVDCYPRGFVGDLCQVIQPAGPGQPPSGRFAFSRALRCRLVTCVATQTVHLTLRFAVILVDLLAICVKSFDLQDPVNLLQVASPSRVLCDVDW
ncbi:hypothetical protein J6590_002449 [Homalodisca vitripennis]|nr:hypothetical protein J6590_002449 [Homalodisca vitripennis]